MHETHGPGRLSPRGSRRRADLAWLALLTLMLISLGSAFLRLGAGNLLAGVTITIVKVSLVTWFYMQLRHASAVTRIAAAAGACMLILLIALGFVDYATRAVAPAQWQSPRQVAPVAAAGPLLPS